MNICFLWRGKEREKENVDCNLYAHGFAFFMFINMKQIIGKRVALNREALSNTDFDFLDFFLSL